MDDKKSFILFADYKQHTDLLSIEEKGYLLDAIFKYANNEKVELTGMPKMAFSFIQLQLDRDKIKYDKYIEKQRENGKKGGRPKSKSDGKNKKPNNPSLLEKTQKTLTVTDTVTVSENENKLLKKVNKKNDLQNGFNEFWEIYDKKTNRKGALKIWESQKLYLKANEIIQGAINFRENRDHKRQFWKQPTTWLNGECWKDEYKKDHDPFYDKPDIVDYDPMAGEYEPEPIKELN